MQDQSGLDKKYFIDETVYNCPFCNRRNVAYRIVKDFDFDWTVEKKCYVYLVECSYCEKTSLHLSYRYLIDKTRILSARKGNFYPFLSGIDIDSQIFYSVPTSFFIIDDRIPRIMRELITEAEGCLKMNHLTGASACARKAIYELLIHEKADGSDYESRIKSLKKKYPNSDPSLFDILAQIQDMTSDKIHEQSWDKWDSPHLKLIIETLKTVLYDICVIPALKKDRLLSIQKLQEVIRTDKGKGTNKESRLS